MRLGAMATLADISHSEAARDIYDGIIAEAAHRCASSVLRNQATIGGAVAVADPADELLVALLACDARILIYVPEALELPLSDLLAQREELLAEHALITEIAVSRPQRRTGAALQRIARTPADAPPIVCAAAALLFGEDGTCTAARLALGGVAVRPLCLPEVEAMLTGQVLSEPLIEEAAAAVPSQLAPPSDFKASGEYRREMAGVLARRALRQAWERAGQ